MLLDTHALLWLLNDSTRLGPLARARIETTPRVQFSVASVWELTIKQMLGRVDLGPSFEMDLRESELVELPVNKAHALALVEFPDLIRHDPFDRILAAQARVENIPLVTADRVLLATDGLRALDARL